MKSSQSRVIVGLILVLAGALFLLQNLRIIDFGRLEELLFGGLFGLGALAFLAVYATNREHWWALIPGAALAGISGLLLMESLSPALADAIGGPFFLGVLALGFLLIYVTEREHWWALMPGGIMLTLAAVAAFDQFFGGDVGGVILFLGIAATFGLVSIVPTEHGRQRWALIPAGVGLVLALITGISQVPFANVIWPLALILLGAYMLLRPRRASTPDAPPKKEDLQ